MVPARCTLLVSGVHVSLWVLGCMSNKRGAETFEQLVVIVFEVLDFCDFAVCCSSFHEDQSTYVFICVYIALFVESQN